MMTIHTLVLIAHVLIGAGIIGLVLLQRGKGAEAGAAFGGGASGTIFGARGSANFLSRSTAILATLFFVTSLSLAYLGGQRPPAESLLDTPAPVTNVPALPGASSSEQGAASTTLPSGTAPAPAGTPSAPGATGGAPAVPAVPASGSAPALPQAPAAPTPASP